jgi:hypothetical protein
MGMDRQLLSSRDQKTFLLDFKPKFHSDAFHNINGFTR